MRTVRGQRGTDQIRSDFDRLHTALIEAVAACRVDSGKHQVHALRTGTRKLEALLRKALEDHPDAEHFHKAARRSQRELKRMRRAAGPVRDLDVHREVAEELHHQPAAAVKKAQQEALTRGFAKLDRSLRRRRKRAAAELEQLLKRREVRLERTLEATALAMESLTGASPAPLVTAAKWTRNISTHSLDPSTATFQDDLHGYRKETKAARYVAGLQESSASARTLADRLKQTQDSIGRWHDLMLLAEEAAGLLGKRSAVAGLLRGRRNSAFKAAVESLHTRDGATTVN